jgi:hypothetical protein
LKLCDDEISRSQKRNEIIRHDEGSLIFWHINT